MCGVAVVDGGSEAGDVQRCANLSKCRCVCVRIQVYERFRVRIFEIVKTLTHARSLSPSTFRVIDLQRLLHMLGRLVDQRSKHVLLFGLLDRLQCLIDVQIG